MGGNLIMVGVQPNDVHKRQTGHVFPSIGFGGIPNVKDGVAGLVQRTGHIPVPLMMGLI
jgi:hypothetical protein